MRKISREYKKVGKIKSGVSNGTSRTPFHSQIKDLVNMVKATFFLLEQLEGMPLIETLTYRVKFHINTQLHGNEHVT